MKNIFFIRHTQSEANLKNILASQLNFSLTENGKKHAYEIGSHLRKVESIDKIISSPLTRARQTADLIAKSFDLKVEIDRRLIEQNIGIFSGMTYEEIDKRKDYMHDRSKRWHWIPKDGESYCMISERLSPFFKSIDFIEGTNILFVTHAVTMRLIRAHLEKTLPNYPHKLAENGEVWKINWIDSLSEHKVNTILLMQSSEEKSRSVESYE